MSKTELTAIEGTQMANNYCVASGDHTRDIARLWDFLVYVGQNKDNLKKFKVAFVGVCLNPPYWQYVKDMIEGARTYFLPGHQVDFFLWSDVPKMSDLGVAEFIAEVPTYQELEGDPDRDKKVTRESLAKSIQDIERIPNLTVFPTESVEWPLPTLMRYHLYLQQEEKLREYDYIFHCDVDMRFVDYVGDEILGEGLTAAFHPMYNLRPSFYAPFEPNPESKAYVPQQKHYYAGGFQGGRTEEFIDAMKEIKKTVDYDFGKNYVARWNEESHWNKYLVDHPPAITLSPAYVYPDSLIEQYYEKIWPQKYKPKIVTLTKRFTTSKEAGSATASMLQGL